MKFHIFVLVSAVLTTVSGLGFYAKDSNIYELTPLNFDKVVLGSNYTTIVEFYAPWCGYCKQIKPVYHKLAKYFQEDAKYAINVAAVNCDEEKNKPLCSKYRVQGFPTLMVFRPPKFQRGSPTSSKHIPETYNGQRELPAIVDYMTSRLKNYVKKFHNFTSKSFVDWLNVEDGTEKVVVLSKADGVTPLLKSLAIDFLDSVSVAIVSVKNPVLSPTIKYGDEDIEIPLQEDDTLPVLLVYKQEEKKFVRYKGKKLNKMAKIQKFVMDTAGVVPSEGSLSKKEVKLRKYRGVKESIKDEL
ncbi:thioredoxin-like protein [Metschnikowia bicuspidata var. bicuspidata NRRL YB-4993]|uniref:Thioredoxin-like protein n=1 Tax=Metschnikowia bicuspidata var. bicuspidata NRRL YB-4993 TaxID=869754 RepID=A0A1A0H5H9_9ASCO|nr:thioredoxin-like protein [Metschnikowia bicuspidata var. bicuspidata NRRL YB-4993]OBA19296.1 thioredoxin-like protein [Metschnikowia bicuspidata var. bicuspidata NRRL YB-4993]